LENEDAVSAIDTSTNTIIATIPIGQQPQALVYVPDAVPNGDGSANLTPLGDAGKAAHLKLAPPQGNDSLARATVSVNSLGPLDPLQAAVSGLKPMSSYTLWLVTSRTAPFENKEAPVTFKTNLAGAQVAQAIGPLQQVLTRADVSVSQPEERFLLLTPEGSETPELIQNDKAGALK
jgi:YVTN family beta-propeller protein